MPSSAGDDPADLPRKAHDYHQHAQKLAHSRPSQTDSPTCLASEAKFVTPFDPVIETQDGKRLPTVPVPEAIKLNRLKDEAEGREPRQPPQTTLREYKHGINQPSKRAEQSADAEAPLREAIAPSHTHPLFPPLPLYGPPSLLRSVQCRFFQATSSVLSLGFLLMIVFGAIVDALPRTWRYLKKRAMLRHPKQERPFYEEEVQRQRERRAAEKAWVKEHKGTRTPEQEKGIPQDGEFIPTEGGPDPLYVDIAYYARRVGLDAQTYKVQTEDGFIIELHHIYNPRDFTPRPDSERGALAPDLFQVQPGDPTYGRAQRYPDGKRKYPILMMHGLLQSAGAYCTNDDDSLAFFLAKSGYDVWLGNNRCGFKPEHVVLQYNDPRMWAWNIRQMGVMDLPALISRVLAETGFPKLALIAHSQGTTQTFVALAKEQRPDIGDKISLFCALAPAVYAGPLIGTIYFRAIRLINYTIFRLVFGIHAFIPLMMEAHKVLPARFYGWFGYHVFSFLFNWSDTRWERDFRNRMFQWAPVYVSAESMRWWLGRECFAKQRCILATQEEGALEDREDQEDDDAALRRLYADREPHLPERRKLQRNLSSFHCLTPHHSHHDSTRAKFAWYDARFPPLALWVCGEDNLVDGRRLLRRLDRGREPHVRVVHRKLLESYEHLDVIWAMDAIDRVGKEVRELIWRTADPDLQRRCRVPVACAAPLDVDPDPALDVPMLHSGGRLRMASISEAGPAGRPQIEYAPDGSVRAVVVPEGTANGVVSARRPRKTSRAGRERVGSVGMEGRSWRRRLSDALYVDLQEKTDPFGG